MPLLALAIVSYFAIIQLANWPERLRYTGKEDAVERTQLSEMVHLRRGVHIYRLPSNGEFDGAIYGPLCYLLGAAVIDRISLPTRLCGCFLSQQLWALRLLPVGWLSH
jgi:hypothetical protein